MEKHPTETYFVYDGEKEKEIKCEAKIGLLRWYTKTEKYVEPLTLTKASAQLGIGRNTLTRILRNEGIELVGDYDFGELEDCFEVHETEGYGDDYENSVVRVIADEMFTIKHFLTKLGNKTPNDIKRQLFYAQEPVKKIQKVPPW